MKQEFAVVPARPYVYAVPGFALLAALIGLGFVAYQGEPKIAWLLPCLLLAACTVVWIVRRNRVALEDGGLHILAGLNQRKVVIDELDLAGARILNLAEHASLKPFLKVMTTRLPGYNAGHFRLRDRSKAFVLVTDYSKVLLLPEKSGRKLLLSLERPQALLDALQRLADRRIAG